MKYGPLEVKKNLTVHWVRGRVCYASCRDELLVSINRGTTWKRFATLPFLKYERLIVRSRLLRRALRNAVHHIVETSEGILFVCMGKRVVKVSSSGQVLGPASRLRGSRPLALCCLGDICFYGEYRDNPNREPVSVWGSSSGQHWRPFLTLENVRHIHGVYIDPFSSSLLVTTGDRDEESMIISSSDLFRSTRVVAGGGQQFRSIRPVFTQDYIYFGSDTPLQRNHIYRVRRDGSGLECLTEVDGSVFHGCRVGGTIVFSTACEPSRVNVSDLATVVFSTDGIHWRQLACFRKDRWPKKLLQYGQVMLPFGPGGDDYLWLTPFATERDQNSLKFSIGGVNCRPQ